MKKIIMFDTSCGTQNVGDYIINRAIDEEMAFLLKDNFVVRYGTHNPILRWTQNLRKNPINVYCKKADYKFICGTNILSKSLNHITPNFNVNVYDANNYAGSILVGCGCGGDNNKIDFRTKFIYRRILSKDYIHSVRDSRTKRFVEELGLKAINTGCPTIWKLTKQFCKTINIKKSENVVFTLTDYCKDREKDGFIIDILKLQYKKVYFWIQGSGDLEYLNSFNNVDGIELISPNLDAYEKVLDGGNVDYVGTRLHAGIFAMRHKVRSIILIIDNRARDMKETYNFPAIERDDVDSLESLINKTFVTDVKIDEDKIEEWKAQFK